ncbi:hypothetical protein ACHAPE_008701, partial [Trichoderma viride]
MDARLQNISLVQPGTCEWFFESSLFQKWYDRSEHDNGFLWIKGNPGTGKSTLVKRIFEYCQSKEDYIIAAFFFNARGAELEKTPLGMLRSLLFQLFEHESSLRSQLLAMFRKKQEDYRSNDWVWREPELKSLFLSEIPKWDSKPILLIVDALDECSERDVQDVADFLQDLSTTAIGAGITLDICLSTRHDPFIRFRKHQEVVLEKQKQHYEDIARYISSNLTRRDEAIEEAIKERSSGIFMWVVLIITILNKAYDDGKIEAMREMLDEMPTELGELVTTMLNRNNPDIDETFLILQFVLFAKRLLTPEEIYFAVIAGINRQTPDIWDPLQINPDIIQRRIISCSRGLIEIRKGERETVQFIHGSVNDFLVRNNRLQRLDPKLMPDPVAKSHERLKDCCMSYLMMESLQLPYEQKIGSGLPFLEYASSYLFNHAEEATSVGRTELLQVLKDDSILNRVERLHRRFVKYGEFGRPLNLLHILAARGLTKLVVILLEGGVNINAKGRPCGTALEAAIYFQRKKTVKVLLDKGARLDHRGRLRHSSTLGNAFDSPNKDKLAMLIERGAKKYIWEDSFLGSAVENAMTYGNKELLAMVLDKGAEINPRGVMSTPLSLAAGIGDVEIVKMLLENGARIDTRRIWGTALQSAIVEGNME